MRSMPRGFRPAYSRRFSIGRHFLNGIPRKRYAVGQTISADTPLEPCPFDLLAAKAVQARDRAMLILFSPDM